ncbi:MAG: TRAP transporter large permease [Atribacterota bacterium]|nr:TRAP transporter large permease [Atribacterota bacterium]MDD5636557.1 TRAP transporter large permease [Atribacterota bacterium]
MSLTIVFGIMLIGFLVGIPVAFTMSMAAFSYFVINPVLPNTMVPLRMVVGAESYELMAVPLYMLAAHIMNSMGLTMRIFKFTKALVGHFTGGTAHVNILSSLIFSGMSGSALADASGIGSVLIKAMKDEGYDAEFSAAVTGASATIGPIFPPSIPMVLIGAVAGISIGKLFIGGVIPGILMAVYMSIVSYILSKKRHYPRRERAKWNELWSSFKDAFPALTTPVVILYGILGGIFTPTEAGVIAVFYALVISTFVYKESNFSVLFDMLIKTGRETARIMFIVGSAYALAWVLSRERIALILVDSITTVSSNPIIVLLLIILAYLVVGCFINPSAAIIIFVPMLMPLVKSVGIDLIQFGVITALTLMVGLLTPPVGLSMYIVCDVAEISISQFVRGMGWFWLALVFTILTMVFYPAVVTWLPDLLM